MFPSPGDWELSSEHTGLLSAVGSKVIASLPDEDPALLGANSSCRQRLMFVAAYDHGAC